MHSMCARHEKKITNLSVLIPDYTYLRNSLESFIEKGAVRRPEAPFIPKVLVNVRIPTQHSTCRLTQYQKK